MNNRLINTKVAGGGGGCTDIVDNYDPFGGNGVALYQLNGNANDVSGNYNGTASNVTYGTGVFGQAGVFNGSSSWIRNTSFVRPTDYTVSVWLKSDTTSGERVAIGLNWTIGSGRFAIALKDGGIKYQNGGSGWLTILSSLSTNTWYNVVATYNSSTDNYAAYVNGSQTVSGNLTIPSATVGSGLYLGQFGSSAGYWDGSIDQVRIFNTALTPLEVEALYTEELCICDGTVDTLDILGDGSCIATYQLDGNANDLSGNYSGTPTNVSYGVGEFDLAGVFNNSSSKIDIPLISPTSISLWIYLNSITLNAIFGNSTNTGNFIYLRNDGTIEIDGNGDFLPSTTLQAGVWQHLVFSENNGTITIYINNQPVGNYSATLGDYDVFGARTSGTPQWLDGQLDQVRIFNKALNSTEVTTLYNETACSTDVPKIAYVRTGVSANLTSVLSYNKGQLSELDSISTGTGGGVALDTENNVAYVTYDGGIRSIDISNPGNLIELDNLATSSLSAGWGIQLDLVNEIAYAVGITSNTIVSVDISNPSSMTILDSFSSSDTAGSLELALDLDNNVAYIAAITADKVVSIDISNPSSMSQLNAITHSSLDNVRDIKLDLTNQIAYTASYLSNTITSIDISNPSSMSVLGSLSGLQQAIYLALDLENNVAYVSEYVGNKVTSVNISNPSSMSELDSLGGTGMTRPRKIALDIDEKIAYVAATDSDAISTIDISNPSNLVLIDSITSSNLDGASTIALTF